VNGEPAVAEFAALDRDALGALARRMGAAAFPGMFVALVGPLGAGKTTFAQSFAAGAGVSRNQPVGSPTFTLVHEYSGRLDVIHCDAYRLRSAAEFLELALDEPQAAGATVLVEWADRFPDCLPPDRIEIQFTVADAEHRDVSLRAIGRREAAFVAAITS
jgi:tRNA threonylcarbamoyladenosine biosynthesis protein TsaE